MKRGFNLLGQSYGQLHVVADAGINRDHQRIWACQCTCGGTKTATSHQLRSSEVTCCGCTAREKQRAAATTHGWSRTPTYQAWASAKDRCHNRRNLQYPDYGGRGIRMARAWRESFKAFFAEVGARPSPAHSLDRIKNDRGYIPGNCRWATRSVQQKNRRKVRQFEQQRRRLLPVLMTMGLLTASINGRRG